MTAGDMPMSVSGSFPSGKNPSVITAQLQSTEGERGKSARHQQYCYRLLAIAVVCKTAHSVRDGSQVMYYSRFPLPYSASTFPRCRQVHGLTANSGLCQHDSVCAKGAMTLHRHCITMGMQIDLVHLSLYTSGNKRATPLLYNDGPHMHHSRKSSWCQEQA